MASSPAVVDDQAQKPAQTVALPSRVSARPAISVMWQRPLMDAAAPSAMNASMDSCRGAPVL